MFLSPYGSSTKIQGSSWQYSKTNYAFYMDGLLNCFSLMFVHTQSFSSSWTVPQQRTWDTSSHPWEHQEEEESSRKCDSCHHTHHTAAVYPRYFLYHKISKHRDQPVGEKKRKKLQEVSQPEPALLKLRNKGWYPEVKYMSINSLLWYLRMIARVSFPKQHYVGARGLWLLQNNYPVHLDYLLLSHSSSISFMLF